ncbi:small secreted protein [Streptomyces sp. NBC_01190]|uniref:small secreted protein n=1 Tax=Streptomyces sp. NBC_01190 TaxID=2903767 RepID=UPI00386A5D8A|nr:small secreted protein [Streptomyces sp. NBC_01190]
MNKRLPAALCGVSAVLLAVSSLAGCGSDDTGKKRDAWAKGVCDQAAAQLKKIDDASTAISRVNSGGKPQDVKNADAANFRATSDAYKSLAAIFAQAGPAPGGDEGKKFQQSAVSGLSSLSAQYADLTKQVDALNTSSQAKFAAGLKNVSASFARTAGNVTTTLTMLRQGDTGKALAQQPGCQRVSGTAASPTATSS